MHLIPASLLIWFFSIREKLFLPLLRYNPILNVSVKLIHGDQRHSGNNFNSVSAVVDFTTFDAGARASINSNSTSLYIENLVALEYLLSSFSLHINTTDFAIVDFAILNCDSVVWLGNRVNAPGVQIYKIAV